MIRQSHERPLGELELLIQPLKNCRLLSTNDTDSDGAYDNDLLTSNSPNQLEDSLETLRNDLTTGHSIEQYEVSYYPLMKNFFFIRRFLHLGTSTTKRWFYI